MLHRRATLAVVVCVALAGGVVPRAHTRPQSGWLTFGSLPEEDERREHREDDAYARESTNHPQRAAFIKARKERKNRTNKEDNDFLVGGCDYADVSAAVAESHPTSPWLTTRDIADDLGVAISTVRAWILTGRLISRSGTPGKYLIHPDDYAAFQQAILDEREQRRRGRQ